MAGITLATAQAQLDRWLEAQADVGAERTITSGEDSTTFHDLDTITRQIEYWNRQVMRLSRGSGVGIGRMVVND